MRKRVARTGWTPRALRMLRAMARDGASPERLAELTGQPVEAVRSVLAPTPLKAPTSSPAAPTTVGDRPEVTVEWNPRGERLIEPARDAVFVRRILAEARRCGLM